eukprot:7416544-Alexandrium_andersonii.AAC.1
MCTIRATGHHSQHGPLPNSESHCQSRRARPRLVDGSIRPAVPLRVREARATDQAAPSLARGWFNAPSGGAERTPLSAQWLLNAAADSFEPQPAGPRGA